MAKKLHLVLVAITIDGVAYQSTQIVNIDTEAAKPYVKDGALDPATSAVKYYREQGSEVIEHISSDEKAAAAQQAADEAAAARSTLEEEIAALEAKIASPQLQDDVAALTATIKEKRGALAALQ